MGKKYRLSKKIGGGSVGDIFHGVHIGTGEDVAIKLESVRSKHPQLLYESKVLRYLKGGVGLPERWRNGAGQLRMDAPYCHRDFRRPHFEGPVDEGLREVVIKRGGRFTTFALPHSPLDVVGWDGTVYPWVFPIHAFQPRTGLVHLPPDWHGTFAARGALIMSFVPRATDLHPDAVPCPYPHSSVDCDECLFYCDGEFTSRTGTASGSMTLHPAGLPHGPQPGRYEASIGTERTSELAVMVDTFRPLTVAAAALEVEDAGYMASFGAGGVR